MKRNIFTLAFIVVTMVAMASVNIEKAAGWFESAYAEFTLGGYDSFNAYIAPADGDFSQLDAALIRSYGGYGRVDAIGLKAGLYKLKVIPVANGQEILSEAVVSEELTVVAYDRTGYAHFSHPNGVGAYNNDGTLKADARVIYVTKVNAKTISLDMQVNTNGSTETRIGLQQILQAYEKGVETRPLAVRIIGCLTDKDMDPLESREEGLQVKSKEGAPEMNLTIEGVGQDATISGFGFLLRNCQSVELRNFAIMLCLDDAVSLDTKNKHCWIHNLDLFYGQAGSAADQVKGDGTIDIKALSTNITVSYNHLWDNGKASLCGMKDETTDCYITYHHNWFDHCDSRMPRVRTMSVHVYNNYFDGISKYGAGATSGSSVFVENNYFRNTKYPMLISMQGSDTNNGTEKGTFSGEDGGIIKSYGNYFDGQNTYKPYNSNSVHFDAYEATSRTEQVPAEVKTLQGGTVYSNFDTNSTLIYSYITDNATDVPNIVTGSLGAGRMQHGDFSWTFNNSTEDADSDVNTALKDALVNYSPSVEKIIGNGYTDTNLDNYEDPDQSGSEQPGTGSYECYFTGLQPSSTFYSIIGNYSKDKGSAIVNGVTYTDCLKLEGATSIKFVTSENLTLYLVFEQKETGNIKIDGMKYTSDTNVLTHELMSGEHELTKGDSRNLFYINLLTKSNPDISAVDEIMSEVSEGSIFFDVLGRQMSSPPTQGLYIIYNGRSVKKVLVRSTVMNCL